MSSSLSLDFSPSDKSKFLNTPFDSKSDGYKAITQAANGQLDLIKEYFPLKKECVNALHRVSPKDQDYLTPLHYALAKRQWSVAAYLLNQGIDWDIATQRKGTFGPTAIESLNKIENGLPLLIQSLLDSNEQINVKALITLLSAPDLSEERSREIRNNHDLRIKLREKVNKEDALLIEGAIASTGIETINKTKNGLSIIIQGLVENKNPINVKGLVQVLSSPKLSEERRRELLNNQDLIRRLYKKVNKEDALLIDRAIRSTDLESLNKTENESFVSTTIEIVNTTTNGLSFFIQTLVDSDDSINVESLVTLLSSPELSVECRRELLNNHDLRKKLCQRLKKEEALLVACCLMIGSFTWKANQTDFALSAGLAKLGQPYKEYLPFDGTMCCNQMLLYASYLSGIKNLEEIFDLSVGNVPKFKQKDANKLLKLTLSPSEQVAIMLPVNLILTANLGLDERSKATQLDLSRIDSSMNIKVLFFELKSRFIEHFGLAFKTSQGHFMIHLTESSRIVVCEPIKKVLKDEGSADFNAVYTGMLPWHRETDQKGDEKKS